MSFDELVRICKCVYVCVCLQVKCMYFPGEQFWPIQTVDSWNVIKKRFGKGAFTDSSSSGGLEILFSPLQPQTDLPSHVQPWHGCWYDRDTANEEEEKERVWKL